MKSEVPKTQLHLCVLNNVFHFAKYFLFLCQVTKKQLFQNDDTGNYFRIVLIGAQ